MNPVRCAVIGVGGMGATHCANMRNVHNARLVAVCDIDKEIADKRANEFGCRAFYSVRKLLVSGSCDAVVIATPHYAHTTIGIAALEAGLHVLVEKPISVHKADCERLISAHTNKSQVFSAMFNQRTDPHYRAIKKLINDSELGPVTRVNWIITDWFRTEAYYASGGWRATWRGEGGGVLLNQSPHQLDLLQWLCGMPQRMRAFCHIGKYHDIEVEDEVTACFEYASGATGVFITSTGEAPGTNRLEISGDKGKIVLEEGNLFFYKNETGQKNFSATSSERFARPSSQKIVVPAEGYGGQHLEILQNFIDAIATGTPLISPAAEGIHSVELANAMLYSSLKNATVELPLDSMAFKRTLMRLIKNSRYIKKSRAVDSSDMASSFGH